METYRAINDPIAENARPLILALEEKIHAEFGIQIKIGLEKECFIEPRDAIDSVSDDAKTATQIEALRQQAYSRAAQVHLSHRHPDDAVDVGKPAIVECFHKETRPQKFEFKTTPTDPYRAVIRMDGQCQLLQLQLHDKQVSFESRTNPISTVGLHVNFSLWNDENRNLIDVNSGYKLPFAPIENALYHYLETDLLLIAPNSSAISRLHNFPDAMSTGFLQRKESDDAQRARFEFRSPAANARHDLAILMVMSAIYKGLKEMDRKSTHMNADLSIDVPGIPRTMIDKFKEKGELIDDLKMITGDVRHANALRDAIAQAAEKDNLCQPVIAKSTYFISR